MIQEIKCAISEGKNNPYHGVPPADWSEVAACAVIADLVDREGFSAVVSGTDPEWRQDIIDTLASIIRTCATDGGLK